MSSAACLLLALAPAVPQLLAAADASRLAIEEGVVRIDVTVSEPARPAARALLDVYVRGTENVLCVFREGPQSGRRILVAGDRAWLLVPGVARPIPVGADQRLLGGASVADVARLRFATMFGGEPAPDESADGTPCHVLRLTALSPRAPYASGTLWVGRDDHLPRRVRLALRSGKEAKEIRFTEYGRQDGRTVLRRMEIAHLLRSERGTVTRLAFLDYEARPLPAGLFEVAGARALP